MVVWSGNNRECDSRNESGTRGREGGNDGRADCGILIIMWQSVGGEVLGEESRDRIRTP